MAADLWIEIPNWDRFQHYTERNPVWIKLYTDLGSNPDWSNLSLSQRGLLVSIWTEYARSQRQIRLSEVRARTVPSTEARHFRAHIQSLVYAGWITISASRPPKQRASPEKRREEKELGNSKTAKNNGPVKNRIPCPVCGAPVEGPLALAEHGYRQHAGPYPEHWDDG